MTHHRMYGNPVLRKSTINGHVWKLGDIVYSTPVSIADPVENYGLLYDDASYQTFYNQYKEPGNDCLCWRQRWNAACIYFRVYNQTHKKFEQVERHHRADWR